MLKDAEKKPSRFEDGKETPSNAQVVGLSLSFCVRDIMDGEVQEQDVIQIISSTYARSPQEWDEVIARYKQNYWHVDPTKGEEICRRLLVAGKILQPRVEGHEGPLGHQIDQGFYWLSADQVAEWKKQQGWK
ncbi:hypothetical protein KKF92_01540 [Patescibacteria group bacterium]|nr:hypothetical protein [Patescibacteria group bacterium]